MALKISSNKVSKIIEKALVLEGYEVDKAKDISFHMTDWLDDLQELIKFYNDPNKISSEEIEELLMDFLVHVPNHLAAASKLMLDIEITNIFDVCDKNDNEDVKKVFCCDVFKDSVQGGIIVHSEGLDETEWFIPGGYHIYHCPYCGEFIAGEGYYKDKDK